MSLVIASTTDTQEQVNAALGITSETQPSEAPEQPSGEQAGDSETPEEPRETRDEEEPSQPPQSRHQDVQRRFDRITREKYRALGRVQELERQLQQYQQQAPIEDQPQQPRQQAKAGPPKESDYGPGEYDRYLGDVTRHAVRDEVSAILREQEELAQRRQALTRQQQIVQDYSQRVSQFAQTVPDYLEVLDSVEHIRLPSGMVHALMRHPEGPRLGYELSKRPDQLEYMTSLPHSEMVEELGKFEKRVLARATTPTPGARSQAAPPIRPVGQTATKSTKSPDEMSLSEYKAWRRKHGAKF